MAAERASTMSPVGEDDEGQASPAGAVAEWPTAADMNTARLHNELEENLRDLLSNDSRRVKKALLGLQNHTSFLALHSDLVEAGGVVALVTCLNRYCWQMEVCQLALERIHELCCAPRSQVIQRELKRTGALSAVQAACGTFMIRRQSKIVAWTMRVLRRALLCREVSVRVFAHDSGRLVLKSFNESTGEPEWSMECRQEAAFLEAALQRNEVGESAELDQVEGEMAAPEEHPEVKPQPVWLGSVYRPRLKGDLQEVSKALKKIRNAKAREESRLAEIGIAQKEAEANARGQRTWIM